MNIKHVLGGIGLALALGALAAPVRGQGAPAPGTPPPAPGAVMDGGRAQRLDRLAHRLKLTDAQKASCQAIFAKHKDKLKAERQALRDAHKAYREALEQPDANVDNLRNLNRTLADRKFDLQMEGRAQRQELRAVLTPEQREKAAFMMGRMAGMREGGHGWGGPGGGHKGWGQDGPGPMANPTP